MTRYTCNHCGAPLPIERRRGDLLRCLYCGHDHRVAAKKEADPEPQAITSEKRVGAVVAPYFFGWLLGYFCYLGARDYWWSCYDGEPMMVAGAVALLAGLLSFRAPAALLLGLIGLAGVTKPFLRPIPILGMDEFLSPTSEMGMYYLIPGGLSLLAAYGFFASLHIKDLVPALRAVRPRITVVLATVIGVTASFYVVGPSLYDELLARDQRLLEIHEVGMAACAETLESSDEGPPVAMYHRGPRSNLAYSWCGFLEAPRRHDLDPLYLDEMKQFLRGANENDKWAHRGVSETWSRRLADLDRLEYIVFFDGSDSHAKAVLVHVPSAKILSTFEARGSTRSDTVRELQKAASSSTTTEIIRY